MSKQTNIPKLRFSEFSGEWEEKPFKDIVKINQGLQIAISERLTEKQEGTMFYITNEFLRTNSDKKYFIKDAPKSVICEKDDILMTRTGNTGKVVTNVEGAFHNNFFKIAYPKTIVKEYLVNFLNLSSTQNYILRLAGTSTIPDLNHSDFYKIKFTFPQKEEQTQIATFLTAVDSKIELLQKKKQGLEQYKKGVMQQIFSQKLRFKDDKGNNYPDWEEKKISEIFKVTRGQVLAATKVKNSSENDFKYPVYSSQTLNDGLMGYFNEYLFENAITWTTDGANAGVTKYRKGKFYCTNVCGVLLSGEGYANQMIAELLNTITTRHVSYVGNPKLMNNVMSGIKITIPKSIEEQTKIANFLCAIDDRIGLVNTQLENTQQFKKGLLQQMFV
ncbi:MAG: restriction endonuclease subunit S [Vicingaceae bacterium]|nr:restriction endonuclease subunit S [Vicingaceae bacterium]